MPRAIDFGPGYGVVSFPDDATDEQIVAEYESLEQFRSKALDEAKMVAVRTADLAKQEQPSIGNTLIRAGLGIREGAVGGAKQAVGNITRSLAGLFPESPDPESARNIAFEAGRSLAEEGSRQRTSASELGESLGGGVPGSIAQTLGETIGVSSPSLVAAPLGLTAAAIAAGAQGYGLTVGDYRDRLLQLNPEMPEQEAYDRAQIPAAISGAITGVLTRGFGGVERLIERVAREGLSKAGVAGVLGDASRAALLEFPEESLDQLAQGIIEKVSVNPNKPIREIIEESAMAGLAGTAAGGLMGGGVSAIANAGGAAAEAIERPSRMRRGEELRRSTISNLVESGELLPQQPTGQQPPPLPNAQSTGITPPSPSQEEALEQEESRSLRLRDTAQNRLETQTPESVVNSVVADVTSKWVNPPSIRVAPTFEALPEQIRVAANKAGFSTIRGVNDPNTGEIWLVADALSSPEEARKTILHETIGHLGVHAIIEDQDAFNEFMYGVAVRHLQTELGYTVRERYGNNPVKVGKEVVASLAENPQADPTLWQQIVGAVRSWARRVFNLDVTDNDIRYLLMRSRRAAETGAIGPTNFEADIAFAQQRIPIRIRQPDGTEIEGEFNGYYDLTELGRGPVPSIGFRLPNGSMTHTLLADGQQIVGQVPTFEEWKAQRSGGTSFSVAQTSTPEFGEWFDDSKMVGDDAKPIIFYHGTGSSFDSFKASKEGSLGSGIYFTADPEVAGRYSQNDPYGDKRRGAPNIVPVFLKISNPMEVSAYDPQNGVRQTEDVQVLVKLGMDSGKASRMVEKINEDKGFLGKHLETRLKKAGYDGIVVRYSDGRIREVVVYSPTQIKSAIGNTGAFDPSNPNIAFSVGDQPNLFRNREQVQQAIDNPGLAPDQIAEAEQLAAVQSSMATDEIVGWIMGTPVDDAEARAQRRLSYIEDRRYLSPSPELLSSLPSTTDREKRFKELAGSTVLGHYAKDRTEESAINADLESDKNLIAEAVKKIGKMSNNKLKANFLDAAFKGLVSDYRKYLAQYATTEPAAQNLQAQWRERLNTAERRLNDQVQSPVALQRALSAIAVNIPDMFLVGGTNQAIVDWVLQQGILFSVVSDTVKDWMLVNDGTGSPAMLKYNNLIKDLAVLKDILTKQQQVGNDIEAFEKWFSNSGNTGKISAKQFAERYFKFRTGRDRAVAIASAIEKEIGDLDTRIRSNTIALNRLQTMMSSPDYVASVRKAVEEADVVVRALYTSNNQRVGLIDRDRSVGLWRLRGPLTDQEYVVDLYPSSAQEAENKAQLGAWIGEARQWAFDNQDTDPLLADEYNDLADYVEKYLMHPALDPKSGFTTFPVIRIPGTSIRANLDPFDLATTPAGIFGGLQTIRDVLERVGGRPVRQATQDAVVLDTVMRKVDGINSNSDYGFPAQTRAVLRALESHGMTPAQASIWDELVAEPVLAAAQNRLSPGYEQGDTIVGSGMKLTKEDIAALKIMKRWGDAILAAAPPNVQDRLGNLGISRKAIGNGQYTGHRIAAPWTRNFMVQWAKATDEPAKRKLLAEDHNFRRIVLGYIAEYNPEFDRMNPASRGASNLFKFYRRLANSEKAGIQTFRTWDEVINFLATEMVASGASPDITSALKTANETLFSEISGFIKTFENQVLGATTEEVWGAVPSAVVKTASANNSFTNPRGRLVAPSTFYSYSTASDGRRLNHVGSLRSLLNLKLLQSGYEAKKALEVKLGEMEDDIKRLVGTGINPKDARTMVMESTVKQRKLGEIRYDYAEIVTALRAMEQAFGHLERFETTPKDHYEHAGVAAMNNVASVMKSSLLSSAQAITTNLWSGSLLGPAILHLQTGQMMRALTDVVPAPHMWKTVISRVAAIVEGNKAMKALLGKHMPLWTSMAKAITESAADWRRIQHIAQSSGMVTPYNLKDVLANKRDLKRSAGRVATDDPNTIAEWVNSIMSAPGIRQPTEVLKAVAPRVFDNFVNYAMVAAWDREVDFLKKMGWVAFRNREQAAAATGSDWTDLTKADNVLVPGDLGLRSNKGLERYRQLFSSLGSLDAVLMEFYQRTKGMTPEQRSNAELLSPDEHAALAVQYASISNVATETNRPYSLKGKGSDGVFRNIIGTFMGWAINMAKQISKVLQSHSKDRNFPAVANHLLTIGTMVMLFAAVGAWNWELGDAISELLYEQSSARIQLGNIQDVATAVTYFFQALVNVTPLIGSVMGNLAGVAFTGRGTPFDLASLSPHIGFVADVWNTLKRIKQTGDVTLPMADFTKRWIPMSKIVINRLPIQRGIVDQMNSVRSLNASAPPGTEIKWGQRGGGDARYGPANDEITKLIAVAYEATHHGGNPADVTRRYDEAIAAYVRAGRTQEDAERAVIAALAAKEPIRILTGREMTEDEEVKWVRRMTAGQKQDYMTAQRAWDLLGVVAGRDFSMVSTGRPGGGGGAIAGMPSMIPRGTRATRVGAPSLPRPTAFSSPRSTSGGGSILRRRRGRGRSSILRSRRLRSPRVGTSRVRRSRIRLRATA